ncbi:xanthine uracil vitamin C permease [Lactobacillus selangorensis]|uniref:Xanthine uracil vitamin C permease n=1 Tax=Lactobacillus selangorensis TaxID=81857 RepID=A0A0R2FHR4_9LACO|nr:NCS2 family permease [Lactobacillus selangorensis]KRN28177.1 xanthine uracil vitamin C permease [Lactobacillus selangorensis]KRN30947.1 xanthine uracil vitamin C permease [Lactobacillus selangorensis]
MFKKYFQLQQNHTSVRQELSAGFIGFITLIYVMTINGQVLHHAGEPLGTALIGTILATAVACVLIGFFANVPLMIAPAMGLNAVFTYDLIKTVHLTLSEALLAVFTSGLLFLLLGMTPFVRILDQSISANFKYGIRAGIGLYLVSLGLREGKVIVKSSQSFIAMNTFYNPTMDLTLLTLLIAVILHIRKVHGTYLWVLIIGTILAQITGQVHLHVPSLQDYHYQILFNPAHISVAKVSFWMSVFSLLLIVMFETLGTVPGQLDEVQGNSTTEFDQVTRVVGVSNMTAGLLGTSSMISALESESDIDSGGKTGLTSVFAGAFFVISLAFVPFLGMIPISATAPIMILIGLGMLQSIHSLDIISDAPSVVSASLIIVLIPFTNSISNGMGLGFISYSIIKWCIGEGKKVKWPSYVIGGLFLILFALQMVLKK